MTLVEIISSGILIMGIILVLSLWFSKKKDYVSGRSYDTREAATLHTLPTVGIIWATILAIFLTAGFDIFHLLYLFPLIYIIINFIQTKRVTKSDQRNN